MKSKKYLNQYLIDSTRKKWHDYGASCMYFVTICTKNRSHFFGKIVTSESDLVVPNLETNVCLTNSVFEKIKFTQTNNYPTLKPTRIGQIAIDYWKEIPNHYPFVQLGAYVVMPDHLHGIIKIYQPDKTDWTPNAFGVQSKNLGSIIRAYKSSVKRYANQHNLDFEWQSNYHECVIRNEIGLYFVSRYIYQNTEKWIKSKTDNCPSTI